MRKAGRPKCSGRELETKTGLLSETRNRNREGRERCVLASVEGLVDTGSEGRTNNSAASERAKKRPT